MKTLQHPEPLRAAYKPDELPPMLGLSRSAVYNLLRAGTLRSVRVGRRYVIPVEAVTEFLAGPQPETRGADA